MTWINGRQLDSYTNHDYNISYKYDSENRRISKIVNNVETIYYNKGENIILEQTGNNVLYYLRNELDDLIGLIYNNNLYYYVKNNQKDIIGLVDSNFDIVAKYRYDSWGSIASICDGSDNDISNDMTHIANINPFRYRSYYYDKETELYYLNTRYYNPKWGRFINVDSYGGQIGGNVLSHNMFFMD